MSQNSGSSFGQGVATAGRVIADIRAVLSTILGVVLIVAAVWLLKRAKGNTWEKTALTVQSANCSTFSNSCSLTGTYTPAGSTQIVSVNNLQFPLNSSTPNITAGSIVQIQYNTANFAQTRAVGITGSGDKKIAWILIGIASGIILLSWLWAWAANRSKLVAQGTAGLEAASLVGRLI